MTSVPQDLRYTKEHEWVRVRGPEAEVGISDFAQGELGDVVFVELPAVGAKLSQMKSFGTIDAVKTVSDLFAPVSGVVADEPQAVNDDPYEKGWMVRITLDNPAELDSLLTADAYEKTLGAHA